MSTIHKVPVIRLDGPSYDKEELDTLRSLVQGKLEKIAEKEREQNRLFVADIQRKMNKNIQIVLLKNGKLPEQESEALADIRDFIEKIAEKVFLLPDRVSGVKIIQFPVKPLFYRSEVSLSVTDKRAMILSEVKNFFRHCKVGIEKGIPVKDAVKIAENPVENGKNSPELQQLMEECFF